MEALTSPLWAAAAAARPRRITQGQARAMADIAARHAHEQAQLAATAEQDVPGRLDEVKQKLNINQRGDGSRRAGRPQGA
jgi:hypothetical protein